MVLYNQVKGNENKTIREGEQRTMTGLQKRRLKRKFRRFWKEWGITWEEFEMFLGAVGCIMFPLLLRIALAFFGI